MGRLNFSSLQQRVFSAAIMIPVVLFAVYFNGLPFAALLIICAAIALYEWAKLSLKMDGPALYLILGVIYVPVSLWSCYQIRVDYGIAISFLFVVMVWASDIGAYFMGKTFGGPKMAEKISPNKTWSGYGGALFFPAALAVLYSIVFGLGGMQFLFLIWIFALGVVMGIAGQAGDLLISWFKRSAKVKDTGDIIPGHGGILDRIDSMLLCAPVFLYAIGLLMGAYGG